MRWLCIHCSNELELTAVLAIGGLCGKTVAFKETYKCPTCGRRRMNFRENKDDKIGAVSKPRTSTESAYTVREL